MEKLSWYLREIPRDMLILMFFWENSCPVVSLTIFYQNLTLYSYL